MIEMMEDSEIEEHPLHMKQIKNSIKISGII